MTDRNSVPLPQEHNLLVRCAERARIWLFDNAAPLWSDRGRDSNGMFAEALNANAQKLDLPRRTRVQARQIYAFSELGRLGWCGDWRACVEEATMRLIRNGRRKDGFFIHTLSSRGSPLDLRADLYDHAFVLFSLAHAAEALAQPQLFDLADEIMDLIELHWRHSAGGFREGEVDAPPRRQNPHMHMLEAARVIWVHSHRPRWKALTDELAVLCAKYFIASECGGLTEYFADDWSRLPGMEGQIVEPGHCFEWAWLFERLEADGFAGTANLSDKLVGFARSFGLDRNKFSAVNEVFLDGTVKDPCIRLWPQTERLKAALARLDRTRASNEATEAIRSFNGLSQHFLTSVPGLWRERRDHAGHWLDQPAPASSFYHIVCALSELFRLTAL